MKDEVARIRIVGWRGGLAIAQMPAHLIHRFANVFNPLTGDVLALLCHDDAANVVLDCFVATDKIRCSGPGTAERLAPRWRDALWGARLGKNEFFFCVVCGKGELNAPGGGGCVFRSPHKLKKF